MQHAGDMGQWTPQPPAVEFYCYFFKIQLEIEASIIIREIEKINYSLLFFTIVVVSSCLLSIVDCFDCFCG
jgi:hypothetical protein